VYRLERVEGIAVQGHVAQGARAGLVLAYAVFDQRAVLGEHIGLQLADDQRAMRIRDVELLFDRAQDVVEHHAFLSSSLANANVNCS
jgi:hypothetical protein